MIPGVGLLAWYASAHQAKDIAAGIAAEAAAVAAGSAHGVEARVSGRDIVVRGLANGAGEHDSLMAALINLPDGYVVRTDITLLDDETPPAFSVDYSATRGQRLTASCCAAASDAALASTRIKFPSGSTRLNPAPVRAINSIAAVVLNCVKGDGLKVEVGGHTDDTGDWQANLALSQDRAQAVVDALIARGVPAGRMISRRSRGSGRSWKRCSTRWGSGTLTRSRPGPIRKSPGSMPTLKGSRAA